MLNRIVIINSKIYSKADVLLNDVSGGIQLAGLGNVGKSFFINTLNFLYIIDTNQMRFEGDRRLKESIPHYFPNINQSYVLFEIFKKGYYCILVKGNANNDIDYFKIDSSYKEEFFLTQDNGKQVIKNFQEVHSNFVLQDINIHELAKENLYDLVYSESTKTQAAVWITDKVKRKGRALSNNFTKIYRLLLKSSEIGDDDFKKSLITADNKDITLPVFADRGKDEITELESKQKKIARLKTIGKEYQQLKISIDELHAKTKICCKLKYNFNKQFGQIAKDLEEKTSETSELSIQIRTLETTINNVLTKAKDELNQALGAIPGKISNEKARLKVITDILEEILPYGEKGSLQYQGLENEIEKIKKEYEELITLLTTIKQFNLTEEQVQRKIDQLGLDKEREKKKIKHFGNLLYQKISADKKIRAKVYSLLSKEVSEQTEEKIIDKITKTEKILKIFDGSIDITAIKEKPFETIEELNAKVVEIEKEIKIQQDILETIQERKKKEKKAGELEKNKGEKLKILDKIKSKPKLLEQKGEIEKAITDIGLSKTGIENAIEENNKEIGLKKGELSDKKGEKEKLKIALKKHTEQYEKINSYHEYFEVEETTDLPFEKIFSEFEQTYNSLSRVEKAIHGTETEKGLFNVVSRKLEKDTASLSDFIREVDEELATLSELENSASELLELISHKFTKPTASFLQRYDEFKIFIRNYNRQLSDFPVSNIKELSIRAKDNEELVSDLKKISSISGLGELFSLNPGQQANPEQQANLKLLKYYFEMGIEYKFEQLFDLILEIELKTEEKKTIKLNQQVESNSTNKILKLFLFLNIIKELAINDPENKIVIYIDEVGTIDKINLKQILKFCNTFNFIPIFAGPDEKEGIEKYYIIKPSSRGGGIVVDGRHTKIAQYKNANATILQSN